MGPRGELNPAWVAVGDQQNVARFRFEGTLDALIAIGAVAGVTAPVRSGEWKARLWERMGFPSVDREEIEAKIRDLALARGGDSQQELVGVIAGSSELLDGWRVLYGLRFEDGIGFTCWQQQDGEPREDQPVAARGGVDSANV